MGYRHDMSRESEKKALLPEGWRQFKIHACEEQTSSKGNPMFKFTFFDMELGQEKDVYAIAVQGKRWFLKQILAACGVAAAEDGVYEWDIPDVLEKVMSGRVEHFDDEWINREGKTILTKKDKIAEIQEADCQIAEEEPPIGDDPR